MGFQVWKLRASLLGFGALGLWGFGALGLWGFGGGGERVKGSAFGGFGFGALGLGVEVCEIYVRERKTFSGIQLQNNKHPLQRQTYGHNRFAASMALSAVIVVLAPRACKAKACHRTLNLFMGACLKLT